MGTLSRLLDDVAKLPAEKLRPGTPIEDRGAEMRLLSPLAPNRLDVRRGVVEEKAVKVRVFNGRIHNLVIKKIGVNTLVTHDGARVHIDTVEEFHQYVVGLCSTTTIPKAGA